MVREWLDELMEGMDEENRLLEQSKALYWAYRCLFKAWHDIGIPILGIVLDDAGFDRFLELYSSTGNVSTIAGVPVYRVSDLKEPRT